MWRYRLLLSLVVGLALLPSAGRPAAAQPAARCFPETGLCLAGPIRAYWERNGGLPVFGYPTTEQRFETVAGRGLEVQWFERDRLDPSGERLVNVTRGDGSRNELPAWRPDGRRLAFVSDRAGGSDIFAVDADATNLVNLTNHPALDTAPAWSPDGGRSAFSSDRAGNDELYLMDADGGNLVRLTDHITTDSFPVWSPDGTQIAFWSFRAGAPDIFLINPDGTNLRNLTTTPAIEFLPQWSPDGRQIAMLANSGASPRNDLALVDASGASYRVLTPPALSVESFAWSPDGAEIAFAARGRGASDLFVVRPDDLSLRQLSGTPMASETSPSWGPGGERIAFASDRGGATNIYTAAAWSAEVMEQVTRSGDITELRWVR